MRRVGLVIILLLCVVSSVSAQDTTPEREIYTVLAYGDDVFEPGLWLVTLASEQDTRTVGQWESLELNAVSYVDYLHFDGGVVSDTIKNYFSDENFEVILGNFEAWEEKAHCIVDQVYFWEFAVDSEGEPYTMRYWVVQESRTRIAAINIVLPADDVENLDEYASRLFPDFPSCDDAK